MVTEEGEKMEAAAFGFPAEVRPGATRVGWIGIGVMGGAMAGRLLAAGYPVTAYARTPAKAGFLVAAGARLADSPAAVASASDVVFTMVGNPGDVRAVVLDAATGALSGLRPGGVLVDCTSSSPSLAREVAAAARAAGCHAIDAPVSGGDVGARDGALAILAGGEEAVVGWLAPLFAHLGRPTYMGPPGSGQSSKIANQIAVAGAVVGLGESLAFADAAGLDTRQFLGAVSKGAAGSRVMDLFGERVLSRDFATGGAVRYIIKDLGMALEVGDGQEEVNVLPGSALYRQMFSSMVANGDGDLCLQGLITVVERLNGIRKNPQQPARMAAPGSVGLLQVQSFAAAKCRPVAVSRRPVFAVRASVASAATKDAVLRPFRENRALKIISGLQNFDRNNVASVVTAADKGGATHVDIACDQDLVKLALELTNLPICVSSVNPSAFQSAVEAGAQMIEIGNYDSFYEEGIEFSSEQILKLTRETRKMFPDITLSVTVPHTLSLPDQTRLAELLEEEGADIIQTEGGKCSSPTKPGVLGLIEKATPTLAAAYSISRAVSIPVMCASGLSSVTAPMAVTAGAAGVGVGSAINKLNDVVAMIAEVRSIAEALGTSSRNMSEDLRTVHH
ncbi:hypothetical protein QYE76_015474 [Lolium multiflorum]|uniref:Uncharacterized protein ycf23 n=1 Tax=Lolium multiflorum TaxID=4521 RepID=A0AAD8X986_LOLMU|nr:hypothetical protein QYE76_015474 [Lolium multiflorum]